MSEAQLATAARESRMSIAINAIAELAQDLDNVNSRLSSMKGRLLGQYDDIPTPINAEVEPDRSVIDNLDYRLRMLSEQVIQAKSHLAGLEEL